MSFDAAKRTFEVAFDDGDTSGTIQPYEKVCLDEAPPSDAVAVGSRVIFTHGTYRFRGQDGWPRWREGIITDIQDGGVYVGEWLHEAGRTFQSRLEDLRIPSNLLDLIEHEQTSVAGEAQDIYFAYVAEDAENARRVGKDVAPHPLEIASALKDAGLSVFVDVAGTGSAVEAGLAALRGASVVVCCLSNAFAASTDAVQTLQFAKKSLRKDVIPVIVGARDEDWTFMQTMVGLLIAGDLYIDFRQGHNRAEKTRELLATARGLLSKGAGGLSTTPTSRVPAAASAGPRPVFVSYSWSNSSTAFHAREVSTLSGPAHADPRRLAAAFKEEGLPPWLDIEMLGGGSGLFGDIAKGLKAADVVVACVSNEYADSENATMELQYAYVARAPKAGREPEGAIARRPTGGGGVGGGAAPASHNAPASAAQGQGAQEAVHRGGRRRWR